MIAAIKRFILRNIERAGYVVLKRNSRLDWDVRFDGSQLRYDVIRSAESGTEARTTAQLQAVMRELMSAREATARAERELEKTRARLWQLREAGPPAADTGRNAAQNPPAHLGQPDTENEELRGRVAELLDERRRLKIKIDESPQLDYQLLMRQQAEAAQYKDLDPQFNLLYERVRRFSMTSVERLYAMYKATEYVSRTGIPGSIVESGVWRGGSMMMAALTLQLLNDASRELYLFDTFEGLPSPDRELDLDLWENSQYNEWTRHRRTETSSDWAYASLEEVQCNLASTGYPRNKFKFVKGLVQQTLRDHCPERISLLRLDTDWHDSTAHELEVLYPRISKNGVLILDDYGHLLGQRKAVDDFFKRLDKPVLLNRIDYSGRLTVKT